MLEKQIKVLLDAYFKQVLLHTVFIGALVFSIGISLLLVSMTAMLKNLDHAWIIVTGVTVFLAMMLTVMWVMIQSERRKIELAAAHNIQYRWLTVITELGISYLANRNQKEN